MKSIRPAVTYISSVSILISMLTLLVSCSETNQESDDTYIDPTQELIMKIRSSDRLYTTEYQIHKILTYDDEVTLKGEVLNKNFNVKLPLGERKILIPMDAVLKGYIDFAEFGADNVQITEEPKSITITLPDPKVEITSTKIDHRGVKTFTSYGRSTFSETEKSKLEKQGKEAIYKSIPETGIIDNTRVDAYNTLLPILIEMGYEPSEITVDYRKEFKFNDLYKSLSGLGKN